MRKYILGGILAILLIGGGTDLYMFNKKVPTLENKTPDFVVDANYLFNAFDMNETEAMSKYENKVIEVTGKVISVKNNESDSNIILEADMAMGGGINCSFKYKQEKEIKEGSIVTIKGQCQGYLMDVILNNCKLTE